MAYNITIAEEFKNDNFLGNYEEFREHKKPNTPVEDEMLRNFLEMAKRKGIVESYSEKVMITMEA